MEVPFGGNNERKRGNVECPAQSLVGNRSVLCGSWDCDDLLLYHEASPE